MKSLAACILILFGLIPSILAAPVVKLADKGSFVRLDNGLVAFDIAKENGDISNLTAHGKQLMSQAGYLDWQSNGNNHLHGCDYSLITDPKANGGALAEVCISQKSDERSPFDVELHYILRRGDSGLYAFAVFRHPADAPAGGIGQSRWVLRLNGDLFDTINIDEQRRRPMPPEGTPTRILGPKESMQFTDGPFKDFITDKYHFFADAGEHFVHGWTGSRSHMGCWIVEGSRESMNGGPTKQHNTAHFPRMLLEILTCGHYGASGVSVGEGEVWQKLYGPWMLYVNEGGSPDALWKDARQQADKLRAAWPYDWMHHPLYLPREARGSVSGRIHIADPQMPEASAKEAWVGLAMPAPDWQKQSNNDQFWVRADDDGGFTIPNVPPGSYTLYAFTKGVMDEFRLDGVGIEKGRVTRLGELDWPPLRHGRQLWQIGTPDRSAAEFRHGDDYRQWGLWNRFPEEFPNGVNFLIGKSSEREDWNYAQVCVTSDGEWEGTTWNIIFDLPEVPNPGKATLRMALASAHNATLSVSVNGTSVGRVTTWPDNAMIRAGIHGQYGERYVSFDANLLKNGRNTISLSQISDGSVQKSVMYDCIRLEVDEAGSSKSKEVLFIPN